MNSQESFPRETDKSEAQLSVGQVLEADGVRLVVSKIRDGEVTLSHFETGERGQISESELLARIRCRDVQILVAGARPVGTAFAAKDTRDNLLKGLPIDVFSPAAQKLMLAKHGVLQALRERGFHRFNDLKLLDLEMLELESKISTPRGFSASTIRSAAARAKTCGNSARALLPMYHLRGGAGVPRIDSVAENFLSETLALAVKEPVRLRISDIDLAVQAKVFKWNCSLPKAEWVDAPSRQTVSRRFHATFSEHQIAVRNFGKRHADRQYRETHPRIREEFPGGTYQIDDTDGEVFLIDEISGLDWGRPYITVAIDEASLAIVGFQISEHPRSIESAIACIANAILPQDMTKPEYSECKSDWVGCGVPGIIVMDNATYNHAEAVEKMIAEIGSVPAWSKPHTPTGKSHIENLNHLIKTEFTPDLPGWRGPKNSREAISNGQRGAEIGLQTYRRLFAKWVTDVYSDTPRRDGRTPREVWNEHHALCVPTLPTDKKAIQLMSTLRESLKFRQSGGLLRLGLRYQCEELADLRHHVGTVGTVDVRIDPYDLSVLYVWDPRQSRFIDVPCVEPKPYLNGLTNYQQQLILQRVRQRNRENGSIVSLVEARRELVSLTAAARKSTKMASRRAAKRSGLTTVGECTNEGTVGAEPYTEANLAHDIVKLHLIGTDPDSFP